MAKRPEKLRKISIPGSEEDIALKQTSAIQQVQELLAGGDEYLNISVDEFEFHPSNDYREEDDVQGIEQLANELHRQGMHHNLVANKQDSQGKYRLLSGERRLRAVLLNRERYPAEIKWQTVHTKVLRNLTQRQEEIVLDGANLQARGSGSKDEARQRRAVIRFVNNIRLEYGITEDEAIEIATSLGLTERTIRTNLDIGKRLHPALGKLLDEKIVTKTESAKLITLTDAEQNHIASAINSILEEAGTQDDVEAYKSNVVAAIENNLPVQQVKPKKKVTQSAVQKKRESLVTASSALKKKADIVKSKKSYFGKLDDASQKIIASALQETACILRELSEELGISIEGISER